MPDDQPPHPPALSDAELRETLDLMSTVLASLSNRVDAQTGALDRLTKTAAEARIAAFVARDQTDPKHHGQIIGQMVAHGIEQSLDGLGRFRADLAKTAREAAAALKAANDDGGAIYRSNQAAAEAEARIKRVRPRLILLATVLTIGISATLILTLPRFFSASNSTVCIVLGGRHFVSYDGKPACAFWGD